jgi:hypothetical protein
MCQQIVEHVWKNLLFAWEFFINVPMRVNHSKQVQVHWEPQKTYNLNTASFRLSQSRRQFSSLKSYFLPN